MLLSNKSFVGGRPLKGAKLEFDREDSRMAYKIGYVECSQCKRNIPISVPSEMINGFLDSCFYTVKETNPVKILKGKIGEWFIHRGENLARVRQKKEVNGVWITQ